VGRVRRQPLRHAGRPGARATRRRAPALLEIELQGARQVRAREADAQLVFLAPPSWAELESRLAGRGSEPPAVQESG
jgi:guanylate kinase